MSTIKVDTIATRTGSGNITASNTIAGTSATLSGTLGVTGATTLSSNVAVNGGTGGQVATNFSSASTMGMKINDTNSGNLGGMLGFYSGSGAGTLRANIQNANNAGVHFSVGTGGSVVFTQTGYTAANALDDYEEGTWTPAFQNDGATTYSVQVGAYVKIGQVVHAFFHLDITSNSIGATNLRIETLPFTANSDGNVYGHTSTFHCNNWSTANKPDNGIVPSNTTYVDLYISQGITGIGIPNGNDIGGGNMLACITYRAS